MAKDPAVLFYTSDFLTGTLTMTYEQTGKYIKLLCLQHQQGFLTEEDIKSICGKHDAKIMAKFQKNGNGTYYQHRMKLEMEKRKKYSEDQRKRIMKRWKPPDTPV